MSESSRSEQLLALVDLITKAAHTIVDEWQKSPSPASEQAPSSEVELPSWELYNARRVIISACGAFAGLVQDPQSRILEVAASFEEARCLHIAVEHHIPDVLERLEPGNSRGVPIDELAAEVGVNKEKLARIMRALVSSHIFKEVTPGCFANNTTSACLVKNDQLCAFVRWVGSDIYTGSTKTPDILRDPVKGNSTSVACTPFAEAVGAEHGYWSWLEEKVPLPDGSIGQRPSLEMFGLAMVGGGRVTSTAIFYDFPWASLGQATVVDVGGGMGGVVLDLSRLYQDLNFVLQDRPAVLEKAREVLTDAHLDGLDSRIAFVPHDFFEENPVKGAEVYHLRWILHDWPDDECVVILRAIRASMNSNSRILATELVMNTTLGCDELTSAPPPLPANYGVATRLAHEVDMNVMTVLNGGFERTPEEIHALAERADLELVKIWECRGLVSVVELRLPAEV